MAESQVRHVRSRDDDADAALVARVVARDQGAFQLLYDRYRLPLTRFLTRQTRRPAMVEELLNDTMLAVWNQLAGFEGHSRLSTWMFTIAYRKAARALERSDDPVDSDDLDYGACDAPGPEETTERGQTHVALRLALQRLSPDHRTVVDLTYFHGMGYREIAEIMDCPVDTVKTRMFHARKYLKNILSGASPDWL